jgi:uncharacterized LabA/DUF88 family protein
MAFVHSHGEKMTDVNIAIEMTKDAHSDRFHTAVLVTGDSDQTPTIRMIRELFPKKRVICAFPPKRVSLELRKVAHGWVSINANILSKSQLPSPVLRADGYPLTRPATWA